MRSALSVVVLILLALVLIDRVAADRTLVSITAKATGKYVGTDGGDLVPRHGGLATHQIFDQRDAGNGMIALWANANGKYVSVQGGDVLTASADNLGAWEQFQQIKTADGYSGLKSQKNGRFVSFQNGHLVAAAGDLGENEKFVLSVVVDIWAAVTAFANRYPDKSKFRTEGPASMTEHRERMHGNDLYMIENFPNFPRFAPDGQIVWNRYGLQMIGDWEVFTCWATRPEGQSGAKWNIPKTVRYLIPFISEQSPSATDNHWNTHTPPDCGMDLVGQSTEWGNHGPAFIKDLGNDIGVRWVLPVQYKSQPEIWAVDLGPAPGVFDPQWGILAYTDTNGSWLWFGRLGTPTGSTNPWPACLP